MTVTATVSIPGSTVTIDAIQDSGIFYALINIDGEFWDHREFPTEVERDAFMAAPYLGDKPKVEVETKEVLDRSYLDTVDGPWRRLR